LNKKAVPGREGFTLVEIILAVSLFVLIISTFGFLLRRAGDAIASVDGLSHALYAARSEMEEIRQISFDKLLTLNGSVFCGGRGKILVIPVLADLLRIELELKWNPKRPAIRLYSLRSKYL